MEQKKPRYPAQYALFLMAYYTTNTIYQSFLSLYYQSTGLNDARIGAIFAGVALTSVFAQPLFGTLADRMKVKNVLLRTLAAAGALTVVTFQFSGNFVMTLLLGCLFGAFYTSIQPMGDSIILDALQKHDHPFGPIRMAGGLSFAVGSVVFGAILNVEGREVWILYIIAGMLMLVFLSTYALPRTPGVQSGGGKKMNMTALFKYKDLMLLLLFMAPIQITMGYFYTFFSPHFISLPGANKAILGTCYFISATSEVPYLIFSDKLFKKLGVGKLMCISALALSVRWLLLGWTDNIYVAMVSQLCHGWGFIVMTVSLAKYISIVVPPELRASGQMLLAVVSFGIARVVGNFGGGLLADVIGRQNVFFLNAVICIVTLACFAPYYLRRKPLNGLTK